MTDAARDDARLWRAEARRLVSGANLVALLVAVGFGVFGVFDSMVDADGARIWGTLVVAAPSAYAAWCVLEPAWRRRPEMVGLLLRIASGCLVAPLLAAVSIGIVQAVAVAFPGVRNLIEAAAEANRGFHYFWSEGIVSQLFLVPVAGWAIGGFAGLMGVLIVTLPVLSLRRPAAVTAGSHIDEVSSGRRDATAALVFCGLGALTLGICLWIFGDGGSLLDAPAAAVQLIGAWSRLGVFRWSEAIWLSGVACVVVGVTMCAVAAVTVVRARRRAARGEG